MIDKIFHFFGYHTFKDDGKFYGLCCSKCRVCNKVVNHGPPHLIGFRFKGVCQ